MNRTLTILGAVVALSGAAMALPEQKYSPGNQSGTGTSQTYRPDQAMRILSDMRKAVTGFEATFRTQGSLLSSAGRTSEALAKNHQAQVMRGVGGVLRITSGVLTVKDRYEATGDLGHSLGTASANTLLSGVLSAPTLTTTAGCTLADWMGHQSQKPLCDYMTRDVLSPDRYSRGVLLWVEEGAYGAGRWMQKPDAVGAVTGTGDWLRRGVKGAAETVWDVGTGMFNAFMRGISGDKPGK